MSDISRPHGRFALILRPLLWGLFLGLVVAATEIFTVLLYLQLTRKIEGKAFVNFSTFFVVHLSLSILLALVCGLVWSLLSFTPWYGKVGPERVRPWERGSFVGLFFLAYGCRAVGWEDEGSRSWCSRSTLHRL